MRKRNWSEYNRQLIQRGSLTFLIEPKLLKNLTVKKTSQRGRPLQFSDALIEMLAFVKVHYKLAYRALQGFASFFLSKFLPAHKAPSYSLVCKRIKDLGKRLQTFPSTRGAVIILDSSGMKVYGEGEWKVKIHGRGRPRKWVKVHLAIDADTQQIVAEAVTEPTIVDSKMVTSLLEQVKERPSKVLADGAYDRQESRKAIKARKADPIVPPPRNAKYAFKNDERDRAILEILGFGGDEKARSLWGKLTGYNMRVLVESAFSSLKRLFGERFFSKTPERQKVESRIRCHIINKMRTRAV
jgi:hypothetical protein